MAITDGLCLRLEAPTGVVDQSPVNRTGMAYQGGMGTALDSGRLCYVFDGTNDTITIPAIDLTGTSTVSLSVWHNQAVYNDLGHLFFEMPANYNVSIVGLAINFNDASGEGFAGVRGNVGVSSQQLTRPAVNTWTHWTFIFDKTKATNEVEIYQNGALAGTTRPFNRNNTNAFGNVASFFGSRNNAAFFYAGKADSLHLHNRRLMLPEIQFLASARGAGVNRFVLGGNAVVNPIISNPFQPVIF